VNLNSTNEAQDSNAYFRGVCRITVGAASEYRQNFGDDGADQLVYGAGATYAWDAWTGTWLTRGDYEKAVGKRRWPIQCCSRRHRTYCLLQLGPGITLDGLLEYSSYKSNDLLAQTTRLSLESVRRSFWPCGWRRLLGLVPIATAPLYEAGPGRRTGAEGVSKLASPGRRKLSASMVGRIGVGDSTRQGPSAELRHRISSALGV
jgi:hypothetical protein